MSGIGTLGDGALSPTLAREGDAISNANILGRKS